MRVYSLILVVAVYLMPDARPVIAAGLADWLASADAQNPAILAAQNRWRAAQARVDRENGWPDPMLGFNVERDNTTFNDYMNFEYMIEQEIPWPGRLGTQREVARIEAEAVGFEMLEVRRQQHAAIAAAAWNLWAARTNLATLQRQSEVTRTMADATRARVEAGQVPQAEWLRWRVQADKLDNQVITMEREIGVALARLNAGLNEPSETPRDTSHLSLPPPIVWSLAELEKNARQYCCVLMAMVWREMARDLARKAVRLEQRPELAVTVAARQFRETGSIDELDTGVTMSFPWLWGGKYRGARAEAEAELQMARADLEGEIAATLLEIKEMYVEVDSRRRNLDQYEQKILPQTRALVDSALPLYQSGMMPAMELLDALRMVQEAEMEYNTEKAAYAGAHARLLAIAQPWTSEELETGLPLHHEPITEFLPSATTDRLTPENLP